MFQNIKLSPDVTVATTDGYFDNQEDISCLSTSWTVDGAFSTTYVYDTLEYVLTWKDKEHLNQMRTVWSKVE